MSYKTYAKYVDFNIEWIGEVPEHWNLTKVKHELIFLNHKRVPLSAIDRTDMERLYDYYGASGVIDKVDSYLFDGKYILVGEDGANLLSRSTPLAFIAEGKFWVNNHAHILSPINNNLDYFAFLLESVDFTPFIEGSAQPKLTADNLKNINIIKPPIEEQKQIANYLDKKTAKIDATIAKNEELIQLLEEKRVALINQVVTKGLNPDVAMKDSGVEWIGEIPEHWGVNPLKSVVNIIMGQSPNSNDINDENQGILFMQGNADFTDKYPNPSEYCIAPNKISRKGDILMSVRAPVGELNISDKRYGIGRGLCSIQPIKVTQSFLWYYLIKSKLDFNYYSNGSTFDAITVGNLSSFPITIPKLTEQKQIGNYLNKETSKIDKIIEKVTKNITLLEEYKTSLIHHVVTGKIDVRGEEI